MKRRRAIEDIADRFWVELVEAVGPAHTMAEVRPACVLAARRLEHHLVEALRTRSLQIAVLPNIGTTRHPIRAIRLRATFGHKLECFDPTHPKGDESSAIVIDDSGRLRRVTANVRGDVHWADIDDSELIAEDAYNIKEKYKLLMQRNLRADELGELAKVMLAVIDRVEQELERDT